MGGDIVFNRKNCIFMSSMPVVIGTCKWRETTGKYAITLHNCIPVTDKVIIYEQNKIIAIAPLYVCIKFEPIWMLLPGYSYFEPYSVLDLTTLVACICKTLK